ncbi:MAG: tetratricopeptide repeat protein [Acidimicrobiales bacterium]
MFASAHFTPSLLDADTLEQLFVNRHHHLDDALGRIERAAASDERAAKLFVGPRGAGKTHLISLVYHRARALPGFGSRFQLAWLPEDLWTIGSLDDLATEIVAALEPGLAATTGGPVAGILEAARRAGPIVVLVENLDVVLEAIGADGQRRLRALLENHRPLLWVATATRLGDDLLDQAEPFYGFFDTTALEPFDVDGAARMLKRIAQLNGETELAARLDDPRARSRLTTIAHLAGGQPRVWALLARGLTFERLDELVSALVERFDDLTPYYQQQLERLSLNERRAVRALAAADGAITVGELAERTGIEARSLGKTVTDLRRRGWVLRRTGPLTDLGDQRRSYYQLAEPLARLAFQLKEARGRPIGLVVEFLKAWFDLESLAVPGVNDGLATAYREAAHRSLLSDVPMVVAKALAEHGSRPAWATDPTVGLFHPDPKATVNASVTALLLVLDDALAAYQAGDPEPLLRQPPAISHLIERQLDGDNAGLRRLDLARLGFGGGSAEEWIPRLERLCSELTGLGNAEATALLALYQIRRSSLGPADVLLAKVAAAASADTSALLLWTGEQLLEARQPDRARTILAAATPDMAAGAQLRLAIALEAACQRSGHFRDVVAVWEQTTTRLSGALGPEHPDTLTSRDNLAYAYLWADDLDRAIPLYETTLAERERALGPEHPGTLSSRDNLAGAYLVTGDPGRAIPLYETTLAERERVLGPEHPGTLASRDNLADAYWVAGDPGRAIPLFEATLAGRERVLGPEHPGTLASRDILACAYRVAWDPGRAIPLFEATLAERERVLGPEHPDTLTSRNNLAYAYDSARDLGRAIPLFEATLAERERILGPEHPDTLTSRNNLAGARNASEAPGHPGPGAHGTRTAQPTALE